MRLVYLDTSGCVKRYVLEAGSERIEEVFAARTARACSSLGFVEAQAAVVRRNRREPGAGPLDQSLTDISADWDDFLRIRISDSIVEKARAHAVAFGLRAADAIHLASAHGLSRRKPKAYDELVVAASDQELLAAADQLGLEVWNPEDGS